MIKYRFCIDFKFMKKYLIFLFFIFSHFSAFANQVNLNCSPVISNCQNCQSYQTLFPIQNLLENDESLDIEADQSQISSDKYILSGDVEIGSNNLFLSANDVEVSTINNSIYASGDVQFQDESYLIKGKTLSAERDKENINAIATNASYQDYSVGIGGANGFTQIIEKTPSNILLTNSTYSLCPVNKNDWLINADEINIDLNKNRGQAKNATLVFHGVPIFYTPKYSWVVSGRGSGFLTPDFSRYNENGEKKRSYSLRVPYYFNLAPDQDLLLALNYMSSRGMIYEGKYRKLIAPKISPDNEDSIWSLEAKFLQEDKINKLKRWLVDFSQEMDLSNQTHLSIKFNRVSDAKYFEEVARTNTNELSLISHIEIAHNDTENDLKASFFSENEQIVNEGTPVYTKALEGTISKTFNKDSKMPFEVNLLSTKFAHKTEAKTTGVRNHIDLKLSRELIIDYPKITPYARSAMTSYSLKNTSNASRTIIGAGVDFDFTVNKTSKLFGFNVNHQISPIISYNYRPKKDQSNIPIFDSTDKFDSLITFKDIVSGERYNGLDRISNANDLTLSLESSYRDLNGFEDEKKKDLLNLKIAQTFFAEKEVVSDQANTNYEDRKSYSDIALSIDLSVNKFSLSSAGQYNPGKSKFLQTKNSISYNPTDRKFLAYTILDEEKKQTDQIHGAYPLNDSVHFFGGIAKTTSTVKSENSESETTGIAYESCCWAFRVAHFKEDNSSGGYNYSTGMELIFKGLGSTSSPLKDRIESRIPGYVARLR